MLLLTLMLQNNIWRYLKYFYIFNYIIIQKGKYSQNGIKWQAETYKSFSFSTNILFKKNFFYKIMRKLPEFEYSTGVIFWTVMCPPTLYMSKLNLSMKIFGDEAHGGNLKLDEGTGQASGVRGNIESLLWLSLCSPPEGTERRRPSIVSHCKERSHQELHWPARDLGLGRWMTRKHLVFKPRTLT